MNLEKCFRMSFLPRSFHDEDNQRKRASRLAMVTVLQFAEGLTDRQAAHAVHTRMDVKYA